MPAQTYAQPDENLINLFWDTARTTAGAMEIHPGCEQYLRDFITAGVAKMQADHRTTPADIALATGNLRSFINIMKAEAVLFNHPQSLGEDTFLGAQQVLAQRAAAMAFWPFWPL